MGWLPPDVLKCCFCQVIKSSFQRSLYPFAAACPFHIVSYYYSNGAALVVKPLTIQSGEKLLLIIKSFQPIAQGQARASQRGARSVLHMNQSISWLTYITDWSELIASPLKKSSCAWSYTVRLYIITWKPSNSLCLFTVNKFPKLWPLQMHFKSPLFSAAASLSLYYCFFFFFIET